MFLCNYFSVSFSAFVWKCGKIVLVKWLETVLCIYEMCFVINIYKTVDSFRQIQWILKTVALTQSGIKNLAIAH